eukprot:2866247-Prymnesium_polylepis.1
MQLGPRPLALLQHRSRVVPVACVPLVVRFPALRRCHALLGVDVNFFPRLVDRLVELLYFAAGSDEEPRRVRFGQLQSELRRQRCDSERWVGRGHRDNDRRFEGREGRRVARAHSHDDGAIVAEKPLRLRHVTRDALRLMVVAAVPLQQQQRLSPQPHRSVRTPVLCAELDGREDGLRSARQTERRKHVAHERKLLARVPAREEPRRGESVGKAGDRELDTLREAARAQLFVEPFLNIDRALQIETHCSRSEAARDAVSGARCRLDESL